MKLTKAITIRLQRDDYNALVKMCISEDKNLSEIIRQLITNQLEKEREENERRSFCE